MQCLKNQTSLYNSQTTFKVRFRQLVSIYKTLPSPPEQNRVNANFQVAHRAKVAQRTVEKQKRKISTSLYTQENPQQVLRLRNILQLSEIWLCKQLQPHLKVLNKTAPAGFDKLTANMV